ncbi:MAG: excinuclease ABC subunit UvrA [Planctomycetaceae bacterium]|nr:excinuclease ABC subunit UvrA [Planctomycetaceae bacterium]
MSDIIVKGAREHNLQNVDLVLPRNKLICFTGVSGSGKSSLAFDTLYAEGQRRYVESLSSYARQFLGQLPKPDVDHIAGLSPAISISQKTGGQSSRSTVGTITEIYDFLRVLFARVATGYCPHCEKPITAQTRQQIVEQIKTHWLDNKMSGGRKPPGTSGNDKKKTKTATTGGLAPPAHALAPLLILAPVVRSQKGEFKDLFADLLRKGYNRARVDGQIVRLADDLKLDRQMRHDIEVVIDRLTEEGFDANRLAESVERALAVGEGNLVVISEPEDGEKGRSSTAGRRRAVLRTESTEDSHAASRLSPTQPPGGRLPTLNLTFSAKYACPDCGISFEPPSPQLFSFNTPRGMCPHCEGIGEIHSFDPDLLIPDPTKSFQQGCVEPIGKWRDMGRWRRHIFQGVAEALEKLYELPQHSVLETAWEEVDPRVQRAILYGTGDKHITYTWRTGTSGHKWGGPYEGIIPKMMSQYRESKSKMQRTAMEKFMKVLPCGFCDGDRLNEQARSFKIETAEEGWWETSQSVRADGHKPSGSVPESRPLGTGGLAPPRSCALTLPQICRLPISRMQYFFKSLHLSESGQKIAAEALKEIRNRLGFLVNVGLEYLTLSRTAPTLSGGEMQRIRLASQIGSGLVGVLYILDEPSIGLHPRDNDRLLSTLAKLRDLGNTVIVVEHDEDTMRAADLIVDFGPGPGIHGGHVGQINVLDEFISHKGTKDTKNVNKKTSCPSCLCEKKNKFSSLTLKYLTGEESMPLPQTRRPIDPAKKISIHGAEHNNLKKVDVEIPLGTFVCVTGVSGSGKSSLVNDIIVEALNRDLNRGCGNPGTHQKIEGLDHLDKMIDIDQSPIGRGSHSNPATYIKLFDEIRNLFAALPEAKIKGYLPGRFSFNVKGGRCESCEGRGTQKLEMDFLADIYITCPACQGARFNHETLSVKYKDKSITDVLNMDVEEALTHFENHPKIRHYLTMLNRVGLGYMKLGQPSPTLSGGEAQRIKLARELVKRSTGKTLYLLDEPTTGLHFADIKMLLGILHDFADAGNTVLVVEHNLDVIKTADWVIDLGPEGGEEGGHIVAVGTPEEIVDNVNSYTGRSLRKVLGKISQKGKKVGNRPPGDCVGDSRQVVPSAEYRTLPPGGRQPTLSSIVVRGATEHNLKNISVEIPRDKMTICSGPSGSGKSSLAMDTVYAEGQRRYVESLSSYARQFIGQLQKPHVEQIEGLSPAIAIEQKAASHSPRSTVGTITEIQDYLRVLYARLGTPYCPLCGIPVSTQTLDDIVAKIIADYITVPSPLGERDRVRGRIVEEASSPHPNPLPEGEGVRARILIAAPLVIEVGHNYDDLWKRLRSDGFQRVRIDGSTFPLASPPEIDRRRKHDVEVIVDRIQIGGAMEAAARSRLSESVESALSLGGGIIHVIEADESQIERQWKRTIHSQHLSCGKCGRSFERLTPHNFSANSPLGWCMNCEGLGVQWGTNPALFLEDPKLTIMDGAVQLFPSGKSPLGSAMLAAFAKQTDIPLDVPFEQLDARHRRLIFHGTGNTWYRAEYELNKSRGHKPPGESTQYFTFQYKGLYPAMEEAMRLVPTLRMQNIALIGEVECGACMGSRLRDDASAVRFMDHTIDQIGRMPLGKLLTFLHAWQPDETARKIAGDLLNEIKNRLQFLVDVGLEYLTLSRPAPSLSGGETQRIRLAAQIGSGLVGVLYVLDEPTIGLHPRDNKRLTAALHKLRDLGNTLLVVEHDRDVIASADHVLDFGPQAGIHGGEIVAQGTPVAIGKQRVSVTGPYLSGKKSIPIPKNRRVSKDLANQCPTRSQK